VWVHRQRAKVTGRTPLVLPSSTAVGKPIDYLLLGRRDRFDRHGEVGATLDDELCRAITVRGDERRDGDLASAATG
jgi:hypothetical protein